MAEPAHAAGRGVFSLPPGPLLLFRQVCVLAGAAGILASRQPLPGLVFLLLLLSLDLPRTASLRRLALAGLCFCLGLGYALARAPEPPPRPAWLQEAMAPLEEDGRGLRPATLRLEGTVREVTPLPDHRLRLLLEEARPAFPWKEGTDRPAPYAGRILWTWSNPGCERLPLAGEDIVADMRLAPARGFANPGTWDQDEYWEDRGVFIRAWSRGQGARTAVASAPKASPPVRLREELRRRFLSAQFGSVFDGPPASGGADPPLLSPGAAMLPALIFGDRSFLTQDLTDLFAKGSLSHSLALSGLHLSYAAGMGLALALGLGALFPGVYLKVPRPALALAFALPLAGLYLWLGQAPVSLQRAALMLAFWALLLFLKRPKVMLDGLLAAVAVLLLINPASLFDLSLQLSALSVGAIALCFPAISRLCFALFPVGASPEHDARFSGRHPRLSFLLRGGLGIMLISLCIQVALLPLTARVFGVLTPWFPLNILWLPVLGAWVMPLAFLGLFLSALGLSSFAAPVLAAAAVPGDLLFTLLSFLEAHDLFTAPVMARPHWLAMAGYWLVCLSLPVLLARPPRRHAPRLGPLKPALLILGGLILIAAPALYRMHDSGFPGVTLRLLDVGQGQSALVEWTGLGGAEGSGRAIIDGGGFSGSRFDPGRAIVSPVLTDNALPRVDVVINSHPDTDHLAGLLYILDNFKVGRFLDNGDLPVPGLWERLQAVENRRGFARETVAQGDTIPLAPDLALEVLWPPRTTTGPSAPEETAREESRNNASLILRLMWRGRSLAMVPGDAERPALRALMRERGDLSAQVLILPHHGAAGSRTNGLYQAVRPDLALAATGFANRWGFPAASVHEDLEALGIPLYTTARCGQIRLHWTGSDAAPSLETARDCPR